MWACVRCGAFDQSQGGIIEFLPPCPDSRKPFNNSEIRHEYMSTVNFCGTDTNPLRRTERARIRPQAQAPLSLADGARPTTRLASLQEGGWRFLGKSLFLGGLNVSLDDGRRSDAEFVEAVA